MKRIILAVAVTTASLSLATLTTMAAWTSSVTVNNNVITTGSVDLNVSLDNSSYSKSVSPIQTISGLMPGSNGQGGSFYVRNDSSTGVNFNLTATGTATISGITQPADLTSLKIAVVTQGTTPSLADYRTLSEWQAGRSLNTLNSGVSQQYSIFSSLDSAAADDWQDRTVTFNLTITGSQI